MARAVSVGGRIGMHDVRARAFITAMLVFALALPAGCAMRPPRDGAGWRQVDGIDPSSVDLFRLSGRLAVSDGKDGGSAGFLWIQRGDRIEFELRQPVSQRTWKLVADDTGATLEGGDDGPRSAASAEALLIEALGWHVPVDALRDWVRGLPTAGPVVASERDAQGRLSMLEQDGWRVEYRDWLDGGDWPTRVRAQQPPYSVRLNIKNWAVGHD